MLLRRIKLNYYLFDILELFRFSISLLNHLKKMPNLPYPITLPSLAESQVTKVGVKSPEDVVIVSALRTALGKGRKGGFKDTLADGKAKDKP